MIQSKPLRETGREIGYISYCFRMKVKGEMPLVSLNISDHCLQEILSMVQSIPLPETGGEIRYIS